MAHIRRRPDRSTKPYEVRYRAPDGRERSRSFTRKIDAEQFKATTEADQIRGEWTDPRLGETPFGEWCRHWQAGRIDIGPSTRDRDDSLLRNHVLPAFGDLPLAAIEPVLLRSWIAELVTDGYASATVRKTYQLVAAALAAAVEDGLIPKTPARGIKLPPAESEEMRFLTETEVEALAEVIDPRYRALVLFGAYTGARLGEMASLRTGDLALLRGVAHIPGTKSRASHRTITLPAFLREELARHLGTHGPGADRQLFPAPKGGSLDPNHFRRRFWYPAVDATVGRPMRPHDLRHTHVALLIAAGEDPYVISQRLGHASIRTTYDIYGHLFEGRDARAAEALEEARSRALAGHTRDAGAADVVDLRKKKVENPSRA